MGDNTQNTDINENLDVEDSVIKETNNELTEDNSEILEPELDLEKLASDIVLTVSEEDNLDNAENTKKEINETDSEMVTITKKELDDLKLLLNDSGYDELLKKKELEWKENMELKLSEKTEEFEKYRELTDSEKKRKDLEDRIAAFEEEKKAIQSEKDSLAEIKKQHEDMVKRFNDERLLDSIREDLLNNELPENLAPVLFQLGDAEHIKEKIEEIKGDFKSILRTKTSKYAQTKPPKVSNAVNNNSKHRKNRVEIINAARKNKI